MKNIKVSDLMVPLEEYATVPEEATMYEAVMALEEAQELLDRQRYHYLHRAVLVLDKKGKVLGKVSQLDVLRALEPRYGSIGDSSKISAAGFSPQFLKSMQERYSLFDKSLVDLCRTAVRLKVKDFMHTPTQGEYIAADASLGDAIHMLVMGKHQSLLVTGDSEILGILRLTDVFKEIFQRMKVCEI